MFENIRADVLRVHRCNETLRPIDVLHSLWINYGLQALVIYRFGRWLNGVRKHCFGWLITLPLYPVYWILSAWARNAYGINLDQSATIAPGLYINHFGGVEVRNCHIGPHCNIQQQAKLGPAENTDMGPVIGEGVWIGAHSRICANVNVGDGAAIGVGAVVTQTSQTTVWCSATRAVLPNGIMTIAHCCEAACHKLDPFKRYPIAALRCLNAGPEFSDSVHSQNHCAAEVASSQLYIRLTSKPSSCR